MAQNQRAGREGDELPFQDFLGLRSQPALRIAFSVMACYRLYVSQWVRQLIEVFFSLQCVLLTALWVLIHLLYLSFPSVCLNQSHHLPLLNNLSRLDVLRVTLWINYTLPAIHSPVQNPQVCLADTYKTLLLSYSDRLQCPIQTHDTSNTFSSLAYLYDLLTDDSFEQLSGSDESADSMLETYYVTPLNSTHLLISSRLESMEFSASEGVLKLSQADRNRLHINTSLVDIDYLTDNCFQLSLGLIPIPALVGYNEMMMQSFRYLSRGFFNCTGFVHDLRTREMYRFFYSYFDRLLTVFALIPILIIALMSSNLLWFCHVIVHHMVIFMRFTADHMTPIFMSLATLTLLYALFGIFAVMTGLLNDDGPLCLIVMLAIFSADQYYLVFCNHPVSKRQWPKFFYLFLFVFVAYYLRFNGQLFLYAFLTCYTLLTLSMIYFMHFWELPLVAKAMRQGGLNIGNTSQQRFRAAFYKYQLLLGQYQRPIQQLIQVEIQVGPAIPPPPPPPVPHAATPETTAQ